MKRVKKIEEILKELNNGNLIGDWSPVPNFFKIDSGIISPENKIESGEKSIGLKAFFNSKTLEIKFFVSKFTDEKSTEKLS